MFIIRNHIVLTYIGFAILAIVCCLCIPFPSPSVKYVPMLAALAVSQVGFWLYWTRQELGGNYFHPVVFFLLSFLVIYFQAPCLKAFGCYVTLLDRASSSKYAGFTEIGSALALLGLSFFFLGYFVFARQFGAIYQKPLQDRLRLDSITKGLYGKASRYAALLTLVPTFLYFGFSSGNSFLQGKYSSAVLEAQTLFGSLLHYMIYLLLITAVLLQHLHLVQTSSYTFTTILRRFDRVVLLCAALFLGPFLYAGDRGPIMALVGTLMAPYFLLGKPLNKYLLICLVIIAGAVLTLIGMGRGGKYDSIGKRLVQNSTVETFIPTSTLAGSVVANNLALAIYYGTEHENKTAIGQFHFWQMIGFFPGLRHAIVSVGGLTQEKPDYSISHKLTIYRSGKNYNTGIGSSSLASIILDFGPWGIPVFMFLIGLVLRKTEEYAMKYGNPYAFAIFAFLCYQCVYVNRAVPLALISQSLRIVICLWGMQLLTRYVIKQQEKDSFVSIIVMPKCRYLVESTKQHVIATARWLSVSAWQYATTPKLNRLDVWIVTIIVASVALHIVSNGLQPRRESDSVNRELAGAVAVPPAPKVPEIVIVPPPPKAPEIVVVPPPPKAPEIVAVPPAPKAPKIVVVPSAPKTPEIVAVPPAPETPEIVAVPPAPKAPEIVAVPPAPETPKIVAIPPAPKVPELVAVPPAPETPKIVAIPPAPKVPELVAVPPDLKIATDVPPVVQTLPAVEAELIRELMPIDTTIHAVAASLESVIGQSKKTPADVSTLPRTNPARPDALVKKIPNTLPRRLFRRR